MTTTLGFLGLEDLEDLGDDDWSSWAYPLRKNLLPLIGNGADAGNVVVQETAPGKRLGTLTFVGTTDDRDTLRGYEEASEAVSFTDYDGSTCDVTILEFVPPTYLGGDLWKLTVKLQQESEPEPPEGP